VRAEDVSGVTAIPRLGIDGASSGRRRGRFVVLVGPDGVGKTTIARAIIAQYQGETAYFHFIPSLKRSLASRPPETEDGPPPKMTSGGSRIVGCVRLVRNVLRSWIAYAVRIHPALQRGCLVVGDRWMYGYLVQPHALRFYGPRRFAAALLRLLPAPDLVVNLSAPPDVIWSRKKELTPQHIASELGLWADLPVARPRTFDAGAAPDAIAADVLDALGTPVRNT
jgi:hypothetical protein